MSVSSMTGFAHQQVQTVAGTLSVEIRAVNSRFLELGLRMPEELRQFEGELRAYLTKRIPRGKVELRMSLTSENGAARQINPEALKELMQLQAQVIEAYPQAKPLTVSNILQFDGIVATQDVDADVFKREVFATVEATVLAFEAMRVREGEALSSVLRGYCDQIDAIVQDIAQKLPDILQNIKDKLTQRLEEALSQTLSEHSTLTREEVADRIRQEVTMYALKMDVDEEINRLFTHTKEVRRVLSNGGPVGRKLDFMMQEMNRESNTLGSKAAAIEMTNASMALKLVIEQMREQIQNLQ